MRRWLAPLRIGLSLVLLIYLVWQANPAAIWNLWKALDWNMLALGLLLQFAGVALSAAKWSLLLRARGQILPFRFLLGNYLAGQFANNFLPTTVGGDALRVAQLGRRIGSYSQASASVFLERLTGFLALSVIACTALLFSLRSGAGFTTATWMQWLTAAFAMLAFVALAASFAAPAILRQFGRQLPDRIRQPLQRVAMALADYTPRGVLLLLVLALSFAFQLLWIAVHVVCGAALGLTRVPLLLYALMVPITDILGLAPVFFNNLGVREAVFILYLSQVGIGQEAAIALALLIFSVRLLVSLLGGLVLLFGGTGYTTRGAAA